jgi:hypothetical protein
MDQQLPPAQRPLIYFVHWQHAGALERAERLVKLGYDVRYDYSYNKDELDQTVQRVLALRPQAIVMSLDEFPGYTRSFALGLQARSGLHKVPRIIVGGEAAQVTQTQQRLPGAVFSNWDEMGGALAGALGQEPPAPELSPRAEARAFL